MCAPGGTSAVGFPEPKPVHDDVGEPNLYRCHEQINADERAFRRKQRKKQLHKRGNIEHVERRNERDREISLKPCLLAALGRQYQERKQGQRTKQRHEPKRPERYPVRQGDVENDGGYNENCGVPSRLVPMRRLHSCAIALPGGLHPSLTSRGFWRHGY
jgi:hypothetical protein